MCSFIDAPLSGLSPFRNGWQLFSQLIFGHCQPSSLWQHSSYRYKFLFRSLLCPVATLRWLHTLSQLPDIEQLLRKQPTLPCRLHRPYLLTPLNRRQRLAILTFHYRHIYPHLPPALLWQTLHQGALLADLLGKEQQNYRISLTTQGNMDKEGELTLNFINPQNSVLARLSFVFCHYVGKRTLFIGGLQGAAASVAHEDIQSASKACYGLFPKRLLLEAATLLATALNIEQILAVGNQTHIYCNWRYHYKKRGQLYADYDSFWISMGGHPCPSGYFRLPLPMPRKAIEDIASKKRAEYRRRYSLLDSLTEQIRQHFATA